MRAPPLSRRAGASAMAVFVVVAADGAHAECVATTVGPRLIGFDCTGVDGDGILTRDPNVVGTVAAGARVEGQDAIGVGDRATVINDGMIDATRYGIDATLDLTLINEGTISGGTAGVFASTATVLNREAGTISTKGGSLRSPAIVGRGDITFDNAGRIEGGVLTFADIQARNRQTGVILGNVDANQLSLDLVNEGRIEGFATALNSVTLANGGIIVGGVSGAYEGIEMINTGIVRSSGDALSSTAGGNIDLRNEGEVSAAADGLSGILDVTVQNDGIIAAGEDAVDAVDARVTNTGSLIAGDYAVRGSGTAIVENAGIVAAGGTAVLGFEFARVENSGTINAGGDGINSFLEVQLTNTGRISTRGSGVVGGEEGATVRNSGAIVARGDGIRYEGSGVVGNAEGGLIQGNSDGVALPEGDVTNAGRIEGRVGIDARLDLPTSGQLRVTNQSGGVIRGRSGTSVALGDLGDRVIAAPGSLFDGDVFLRDGDDLLTLQAGARLDGEALFGAGDDRFSYERSMLEETMDAFDLFDGGEGFDVARLNGYSLTDLDILDRTRDGFEFLFSEGASSLQLTLANFEAIRLDDFTLQLNANSPAPVPLPASLPMLLAALGGIGLIARRRGG